LDSFQATKKDFAFLLLYLFKRKRFDLANLFYTFAIQNVAVWNSFIKHNISNVASLTFFKSADSPMLMIVALL